MNPTVAENKSNSSSIDSQAPTPKQIEAGVLTAEARAFLLKLAGAFEPGGRNC